MTQRFFNFSIASAAMKAGLIVSRPGELPNIGYTVVHSDLYDRSVAVQIDISTNSFVGTSFGGEQIVAEDWFLLKIPDTFPTEDAVSPSILAKLFPNAEDVLEQLFWQRHEKMRQVDRVDFKNAIRGAICRMIVPPGD